MERCRRTSLTMSPNPQHHLGARASGPQVRSTACTSASASPPACGGLGGAPAPTYNAQTDIIGEPTVTWVRGPPARRYGQRLAPSPGCAGLRPAGTVNGLHRHLGARASGPQVRSTACTSASTSPRWRRVGRLNSIFPRTEFYQQPAHPPACGGLGGAPAPLI